MECLVLVIIVGNKTHERACRRVKVLYGKLTIEILLLLLT